MELGSLDLLARILLGHRHSVCQLVVVVGRVVVAVEHHLTQTHHPINLLITVAQVAVMAGVAAHKPEDIIHSAVSPELVLLELCGDLVVLSLLMQHNHVLQY